jgi:predicted enzyme related to lactoylglutathione lyase
MRLTHSVLITRDVPRLRRFYREVLKMVPSRERPDYVEFSTGGAMLALYELRTHEKYAPGSVETGATKAEHAAKCGVMVEFEVEDADAEHSRLVRVGTQIVMPPTTFPWGNRAFYFRDPDGNLVNFFQRISGAGA